VHYLHALLRKTEGELLKLETHNRTMNTTTKYPPRHIPGFRPLVPGEAWHRTDFTPDMLPEGWRPLLLGEYIVQGDAFYWQTCWRFVKEDFMPAQTGHCLNRTRRPLPPPPPTFEHDGKVWNSHVPGDPCPVHYMKTVEVMGADYDEEQGFSDEFHWPAVIGYRIPDEPANDTAKLRERIAYLETRLEEVKDELFKQDKELATALTPRPIAEAGGVKEGFVRIFFSIAEQGIMGLSGAKWMFATHFIDIKLPAPDPRAEYERALAECGGDPVALYAKMKGGAA
jgi:hypothetical protein